MHLYVIYNVKNAFICITSLISQDNTLKKYFKDFYFHDIVEKIKEKEAWEK